MSLEKYPPSVGVTRPGSESLTAAQVSQRIQERQLREVVVSSNEAIALAEKVKILEKQLADRKRIPIPKFLASISGRITALRQIDWREEAIYNAPAIGAAVGFSASIVLGELQIAGYIDLHLAQPNVAEHANAFRFLHATNIGVLAVLGGNAIGGMVADAKLIRNSLLRRKT